MLLCGPVALQSSVLFAIGIHALLVNVDQQRLQGTWRVVSIKHWKKDYDVKRLAPDEGVIVKYNRIYWGNLTKVDEKWFDTLRIDPTKSPKQITFVNLEDIMRGGYGRRMRSIYRLTGGRLEICNPSTYDSERPVTFDFNGPDEGKLLWTFIRVK